MMVLSFSFKTSCVLVRLARYITIKRSCKEKKKLVSYLFCYETGTSPFQNNPKNLDPSYKMDLDFWDYFVREKAILQPN